MAWCAHLGSRGDGHCHCWGLDLFARCLVSILGLLSVSAAATAGCHRGSPGAESLQSETLPALLLLGSCSVASALWPLLSWPLLSWPGTELCFSAPGSMWLLLSPATNVPLRLRCLQPPSKPRVTLSCLARGKEVSPEASDPPETRRLSTAAAPSPDRSSSGGPPRDRHLPVTTAQGPAQSRRLPASVPAQPSPDSDSA